MKHFPCPLTTDTETLGSLLLTGRNLERQRWGQSLLAGKATEANPAAALIKGLTIVMHASVQ